MEISKNFSTSKFSFTSVLFLGVLAVWLMLENQFGYRVDTVADNSIVDSYLVTPKSKNPIKITTSDWDSFEYVKINSVSETNKVLDVTAIPLLSMLTREEVSEVSNIKIKSLAGSYYYITDISTLFNADGSVSNKISLDKLPPKTLKKLGLKPTKTVIYNEPVGFAKIGDKVLLSKDNKLVTPTVNIEEKVLKYKVPRHTFYKYENRGIVNIYAFEIFMCIWVILLLLIAILF